jgi:hypothetical protein
MTPCRLAINYRRFEGAYCVHLQDEFNRPKMDEVSSSETLVTNR